MVRYLSLSMLLLLVAVGSTVMAAGTADITIGNYLLQPNTPNQKIPIYVTGGAQIGGVNLNVQIGDGGPAWGGTLGPAITDVDFLTGTIFETNHLAPLDTGSTPQLATWYTLTASGHIPANGLVATLTVDTTGFSGLHSWPLRISDTLNGPLEFLDGTAIPGTLVNGTISVPEPSSIALLVSGGMALAVGLWRRRQ